MILTLTGASGAGKTTITNLLLSRLPNAKRIASHTTRSHRETDPLGEYIYLNSSEFMKMDMNGEFLWTVKVHGDYYGTAVKLVDEALNDGDTVYIMVLVKVSISILTSYAQAMAKANRVKSFYILSPGAEVLRGRLEKRGDDKETIERRLIGCAEWDSAAKRSNILFIFLKNDKELGETVDEIICAVSLDS